MSSTPGEFDPSELFDGEAEDIDRVQEDGTQDDMKSVGESDE